MGSGSYEESWMALGKRILYTMIHMRMRPRTNKRMRPRTNKQFSSYCRRSSAHTRHGRMLNRSRFTATLGDEMARVHVVAQKHDTNGHATGRAHSNPFLYTRMYQVEFAGGEVTELTTNIIAESMYAQCDENWNEYLLLALLVDYCKNNKAMSFTDQ